MKELPQEVKKFFKEDDKISIEEFFIDSFKELKVKLEDPKYLTKKDYPSEPDIRFIVENYESDMKDFINLLIFYCKYIQDDEFLKKLMIDLIERFLKIKKNELDGYGYIYRHISSYPLLLALYVINIFAFKFKHYDLLFEIFKIKIQQRYFYDDVMRSDFMSTIIEGINSYHVFSNIDNIRVDVVQYLPMEIPDMERTEVNQIINVSIRIYNYLYPLMERYFLSEGDFSEYFNLYEMFVGIFVMDKRLQNEHDIKFGPYGKSFRKYKTVGRPKDNSFFNNFINDTYNKSNTVLQVGFFDKNPERFKLAYQEYINLINRIY
jgi:hypothetical protein